YGAARHIFQEVSTWPDPSWSTPALLTLVRNLVSPEARASRTERERVLLATSALARLGERGISVDAVMRTCRRRVLRRAAFLNVAIGWLEFQRGRGLDDDDPAGPLIRLLDDEESLQDQRSPTID